MLPYSQVPIRLIIRPRTQTTEAQAAALGQKPQSDMDEKPKPRRPKPRAKKSRKR
jgi:hypothetical protein